MCTTDSENAIRLLDKAKGVNEILKSLASDENTGIVGDPNDIKRRSAIYGKNSKALPKLPNVMDSVKQEIRNILWLIIGVTALFSGLCGLFFVDNERVKKIVEAVSIITVGIIIMFTTAVADYLKD
jgi:magnesium-transporting ATPase (P-type)